MENIKSFDFYLSNDIVQGEDVPFYLLWGREDVEEILIDFEGFERIVEYHNVLDDFPTSKLNVKNEDLKIKHYLGGILKAPLSDNPFQKALLEITFNLSDGEKITLVENRILYSTILSLKAPKMIKIPFEEPPIEIQLKGATTVFIDVESDDESELDFELPKEIRIALETFVSVLVEGLNELKEKYPNDVQMIDSFLDEFKKLKKSSESKFLETANDKIEKTKPNAEFQESLFEIFKKAFQRTSLKDYFFRPLIEYLESCAADKAFLYSPLLCLEVPKGTSVLRGRIFYKNLLDEDKNSLRCEEGITFETNLKSHENIQISIKDLIKIERINNGVR